MIYQVNCDEAKRRLNKLIDAAVRGEKVFITREDEKTVQLVPVDQARPRPRFGSAKGLRKIADDFDEPLDDFNECIQ